MSSRIGCQHHKGTDARLARRIVSDFKFRPRLKMKIVMGRANTYWLEENSVLQLCCKRIKGYSLNAITPCYYWCARQDSNLRPTDS
jgi:hypothetical protein